MFYTRTAQQFLLMRTTKACSLQLICLADINCLFTYLLKATDLKYNVTMIIHKHINVIALSHLIHWISIE